MEAHKLELSATSQRLQSKTEAVEILRKELNKARTDRDQYKLMAETLQLRCSQLKCNCKAVNYSSLCPTQSCFLSFLYGNRVERIPLSTELEALRLRMSDLKGDIEVLRAKKNESYQRESSKCGDSQEMQYQAELRWNVERANLIHKLETLQAENAQLSLDFKALAAEKEDAFGERDAFKCKAHRLNHELLVALRVNDKHPKNLDVDAIILENKYLQERLDNMEAQFQQMKHKLHTYKAITETTRKEELTKYVCRTNKDFLLSESYAKLVQEHGIELPVNTATGLQTFNVALIEALNDRYLELSQRKKLNKILTERITELERRLSNLMVEKPAPAEEAENLARSDILVRDNKTLELKLVSKTNPNTKCVELRKYVNPVHGERLLANVVRISQAKQDDMLSSFSTVSDQSENSSEYTYNNPNETEIYLESENLSGSQPKPYNITHERAGYFNSLPPHLADMVNKVLQDLDTKGSD